MPQTVAAVLPPGLQNAGGKAKRPERLPENWVKYSASKRGAQFAFQGFAAAVPRNE